MIAKVLRLIKLFKQVLVIFEYEWLPSTIKEQAHKQYLIRESWKLIDDFTQEFHLDKIK